MFASFRWVVALTAALAVVFAVSGWAVEGIQWSRLPRELVLVALNTLPLLAVRRNPLAVVAVFSVTYPTWVALGHPIHELQSLPAIAAMYALAGWDRPLWLRALGLVMPVWMVTGGVLLWGGDVLELTFVGVCLTPRRRSRRSTPLWCATHSHSCAGRRDRRRTAVCSCGDPFPTACHRSG